MKSSLIHDHTLEHVVVNSFHDQNCKKVGREYFDNISSFKYFLGLHQRPRFAQVGREKPYYSRPTCLNVGRE